MSNLLAVLLVATQMGALLGDPEVQLPNGLIRGRDDQTIIGKQYHAFEKIPYAAPPVGELRFQSPVAPPSWDGALDTKTLDVSCFSQSENTDAETEDCLFLNVFTPQLPTDDNQPSLPVMVFIHGGGFVWGSARGYNADLILNEDIILVAINYRLGPFGFTSTEDEVIPGNAGLKDQLFAFRWVHDNIQLFGGDPNKVTIFGQSAGSGCVSYQLLNQQGQGLYQGAIMESGTFLGPWSLTRHPREIVFGLASILNDEFRNNNDSNALLQFLQSVDGRDIDRASEQVPGMFINDANQELLQGYLWAPSLEVKNPDAFITKKMYGLLQAGNVVGVPILIGMTSEEALAFIGDANWLRSTMNNFDQHLDWLVPQDMGITDDATRQTVGSSIRDIYTNGGAFADNLGAAARYYSDDIMTRSIIRTAELYSKTADTYFYQFSHDGPLSHNGNQYDGAEHVAHGAELPYIFCQGGGCDRSWAPETDQLAVQRVISIWTNFAKYQNPTPETSDLLQNIEWPKLNTDNGDFFYVDIGEDLEVKNHPKEETYAPWVQLYDNYGYSDFDTY